ncbi:hypothetical protein EDD86DRAFT_201601, partial [Gorgonomyces haynaldii]
MLTRVSFFKQQFRRMSTQFHELLTKNDPRAWQHFRKMDTKLETVHMNHLLRILKKRQLESVDYWLSFVSNHSIPLNAESYNLLLDIYASQKRFDLVKQTLKAMKQNGFSPSIDTFNSVLKIYCNTGDIEMSRQILKNMEDIQPNALSYELVIRACVKNNQMDTALEVYDELLTKQLEPTQGTHTQLVMGFANEGKMSESKVYFDRLKEADLFLCTAMLNGYSKQNDQQGVGAMLQYMEEHQLKPDHAVYQSLIHAHLNNLDVDGAFKILEMMRDKNVIPDNKMYHTLVDGACKLGAIDKALLFATELHDKNIYLHATVFRALMTRLKEANRAEDVYFVFDMAARTQKKMIMPLYNIAMETAVEDKNLEMFKHIWNHLMEDKHMFPNALSYKHCLTAYMNAGDIYSCMELIEQTKAKNLDLDQDTLFQLVKMCIHTRKYMWASQVMARLRSTEKEQSVLKLVKEHSQEFEQLIASSSTMSSEPKTLFDNFQAASDMERRCKLIIDLYQDLKRTHAEMKESTYRITMNAYRQQMDLVGAVKTWTSLHLVYPTPEPSSVCVLLRTCCELGQQSTLKAVKQMIQQHKLILNKDAFEYLLVMNCQLTEGRDSTHLLLDMVNANCPPDARTYQKIKQALGRNKGKPLLDFIEEYFPDIMQDVDDKFDKLPL